MTAVEEVVSRLVNSSPAIVLVMGVIGYVVWTTWRKERLESLQELREERKARAELHQAMLAQGERQLLAIQAVREAVSELRHALKEASHRT